MLTERNKRIRSNLTVLFCTLLTAAAICGHYLWDDWGFYRKVSKEETALRKTVVSTAERYLGYNERDGSHRQIIDRYNTHDPLAMGYEVTYSDSWCAAFVSAVAIECGVTDLIPTECGCERQIGLFQELDCWEEQDSAIPLPGDLIYFDWNMEDTDECTGWADHVGIVVGTKWPFIKVIEGNLNDSVDYHYLHLNHIQIRGFAKPDYTGFLAGKMP